MDNSRFLACLEADYRRIRDVAPGYLDARVPNSDEKLLDTATPDVTISGNPADLFRWTWNRETPDRPIPVRIEGNPEALTELRECVAAATQ